MTPDSIRRAEWQCDVNFRLSYIEKNTYRLSFSGTELEGLAFDTFDYLFLGLKERQKCFDRWVGRE